MKFDDIDTRRLLPHWAHAADWIQAAFDRIAKAAFDRTPAIDVPLTMQAIRTLSDDELQSWYARLGVVEYYPDLSRETREKMLYWCARLYRFLGTPQAVRILCEYVHDGLPMNVDVRDNLAWNGTTLVDPQLLDVFDIAIDAEDVHITPMLANRILQNVLRIARNSQALRNIIYRYTTRIDVPVLPADAPSAAVTEFVENWADSAPQMPMVWRYDEDVLPYETIAPDGTLTTGLQYSASNLYAPVVAINDPMVTHPDFFGWGTQESVGHVAIVNNTGSSKSVMTVTIYRMDSTDAELVTVKNGQNERFNAFKFYMNGDPWWFVIGYAIDGWTDDLAAAGYEEVSPVSELPTVTLDAGWISIYPNHVDLPPNELREGRIWGSGGWVVSTYDPTKSYAAYWWHTDSSGGNLQGYYGIIISDYNGRLGITNVLSYTIPRFVEAHYATCDSPGATAVPVYNSSNVAYTAFKYTIGGVNYFYVLDEVQADWTDDLSSIGYSETPTTVKGWFNDDKTPKVLTSGTTGIVKDSSGNNVVYDNSKTYHIYRTVNSSGNDLPNVTLQIDSGYYLGYKNETGQTLYNAVYVEYYTT